MKNNNKNIVLEEYDGDFSYNKSESNLNISFNRIAFIFFIFFIILILFSTKAIYLGSLTKNIESNNLNSDFRSSITDRNGNLIAKTVLTYNVGINPNLVINKKKIIN